MEHNLFSSTLPEFNQEISNVDLIQSLEQLKRTLRKKSLKILQWSEGNIAIPLDVDVELPPLGNFQGIDIQRIEPVIIVLSLNSYPNIPPKAFPDRLDFPKDQLAHLYVAKKGKPPAFCLVRGSVEEWYSNKRLRDLIIRIANWLRDAAVGVLAEDGNQFDPVRLEGYNGTIIYDYDQLMLLVNESKSFYPDSNFAIALFERQITGDNLTFKIFRILTPDNFNDSFEEFKKEKEKDDKSSSKKYYHFGYLIWSNEDETFSNYSVDLPDDWNGLKSFCKEYNIDLTKLEIQLSKYDLNTYVHVPVIIAIKRPKPIIGFQGRIEFFNFYVRLDTGDVADEKIINNVPIFFQSHNQPLSLKKARLISGFYPELGNYSLILGCGALGSKIVMHLARSGSVDYLLADPDVISPHNLVRHAVFASGEGVNKAIL